MHGIPIIPTGFRKLRNYRISKFSGILKYRDLFQKNTPELYKSHIQSYLKFTRKEHNLIKKVIQSDSSDHITDYQNIDPYSNLFESDFIRSN